MNLQGQLDNSFGNNGKVQVELGSSSNNSCNKVMVLPNNKIMLLGSAFFQGSFDLTMLRLNSGIPNSIAELSTLEKIKIFPNPLKSEILNFEFEIKKEGTARVFNSLGELMIQKELHPGSSHKLGLRKDLNPGMYFLQLYEDGVIKATGQLLID